jgi:small redox-active disulfide protein 2
VVAARGGLIGVPMYTNAAGIIPIVEALLAKGAALGTVLAFMMSVIALSLPEMIILRKVLKPRLIATFAGVVAGCANCKNTIRLIDEVAKARGIEVQLEKVEQIQDIMTYGVMSTPGVVIDGKVVHAGGVPARSKVEGWF